MTRRNVLSNFWRKAWPRCLSPYELTHLIWNDVPICITYVYVLFILIHSYSVLFILIHSYSFLFILIHSYSFLFILIHSYSFLFILIHSDSFLFIFIHYDSFLFIIIHSYSFLFIVNFGVFFSAVWVCLKMADIESTLTNGKWFSDPWDVGEQTFKYFWDIPQYPSVKTLKFQSPFFVGWNRLNSIPTY